MSLSRLLLLVPLLLLATACSTAGYYTQAIGGHTRLMCAAEPIDKVLQDPDTSEELKQQLVWAKKIRQFAVEELGLPDNGSYRKYVQLDRPNVLWNVLATPELSLSPKTTCAPVIGCVAYRNYYSLDAARRYAEKMKKTGHDTYIGGVTAYSTIGWFKDPLVSTMMLRGIPDLAGVVFHELAHQKVYAKSDTAFTESFATVVETEGLRRWLKGKDTKFLGEHTIRQRRYHAFINLILRYREKLLALYRSSANEDEMRQGKSKIFGELLREYDGLKKSWNGYGGFDKWMKNDLNNAKLASVGNYHQWVPHLQQLLKNSGNDLPEFYRRANEIADLGPAERKRLLENLVNS